MRTNLVITVALATFLLAARVDAEEMPAKTRIVAVDLFKNGLAIVKREVVVNGSGTYVLDDVPQPVHGTYSVECTVPIETVVKMREVEVSAEQAVPGNLQEDLAGKKVTIHFKGDKLPPTAGTVMKLKPLKAEEVRASYELGVQPYRFLLLHTAKGRTYLAAPAMSSVHPVAANEKTNP